MGYFDFARIEGFPTQYPEIKTPVTVDVLESGFIAAFLIILVTFYASIIGRKNGVSLATRATLSSVIGLLIMLGNFGQEWEVGHVHSKTAYKAGTKHEIEADIGIKVGLRSVNVTLKADTQNAAKELRGEIINYNERFEWTWDQGRFGFGPYAGLLQREFREAQHRGLPLPILWIVDYLVVDGEGLRFGRFYRTAGWYAHIAAWASLPCWMLANFLFLYVIEYGAILTAITGAFQLLSCLLWASIRNPFELVIPFEDGEIKTSFGISFWLTFANGILCLLIALVVIILDLRFPNEIVGFFGIDPLTTYEEKTLSRSEVEYLRHPLRTSHTNDAEMAPLRNPGSGGEMVSVLKRRTLLKFAQKDLLRRERDQVVPETAQDEEYERLRNEQIQRARVRRPVPQPPVELPLQLDREPRRPEMPWRGVQSGPSHEYHENIEEEEEEIPEYTN